MRKLTVIYIIMLLWLCKATATTVVPQPQDTSINGIINTGIDYLMNDHITQSLDYLQLAHKMSIRKGDSSQLNTIYMYLGENYHKLNACEEACDYYTMASNEYLKNHDTSNYVFAEYCIANNYETLYENSNNKKYLDSAIYIIEEMHPKRLMMNERSTVVTSLIVSRILLSKAEASHYEHKKDMSQEALDIINEGEALMRGYELNEYAMNFKINKISALISLDNISEARELFETINEETLDNMVLSFYYPMATKYYKKTGQYEMLLSNLTKEKKLNYLTYNVEKATEAQKNTAQMQYEELMKQFEQKSIERDELFEVKRQNTKIINKFLMITIGITVIIVLLMVQDNHKLQQQNDKLTEANTLIAEKNHELQEIHDTIDKQKNEIEAQYETIKQQTQISKIFRHRMGEAMRLARSIQNALMPSHIQMSSILHEYFIYWKPVAPVSGDFYWMRQTENYTYLMAADCTGHSVPGALLSMLGISILNGISSAINLASPDTTPGQILDIMKDHFNTSLHIGPQHIGDSIDLALIKIDKKNRRIHYAGANRPLVMISGNEAMEFKPTKMCIGYNIIDRKNFTNNVIDYEANDMVYMFTDGITDQFGDIDGHTKFGTKRLHELMSNISDLSVNIQESAIKANIINWMNIDTYGVAAEQLDDQLLIGVRME